MITEIEFSIKSVNEMQKLAANIACKINSPAFIALNGDLGAGKTEFVRGFIQHLSKDTNYLLRSPTYTIVNEYHLNPVVFHFDVYRLNDSDELYQIGFDDYLSEDAILLIEWASKFNEIYPEEYINIDIYGSGSDIRTVKIKYTKKYIPVFGDLSL